MLRKKGKELQLNSYKIDTQSLQNSLRQLSQMKQTLQSTISHYKTNEDQLLLQNQRLKQQISMLQNKTMPKADHSDCLNKIIKYESQIKEQKRQIQKNKKLYENQKRNKQILTKQFESKLEKQIYQSKIVADNYQQRIGALLVQLKQTKIALQLNKANKLPHKQLIQSKNNQFKSKKNNSTKNQIYNLKSDSQNELMLLANFNNQKIQKYDHSKYINQNKKSNKNMPPKSPNQQNINFQYKSNHQIRNQEKIYLGPEYSYTSKNLYQQNEQVFSISIRKLYNEVKQMGLLAQEMSVLPQFKKMASNQNPSKNDLFHFLKNPPIEQKNDENIQKSVNFVQKYLKNKHGKLSGKLVTQMVIAKVEQYENTSKLNTEDLQISGMTPSISKGSFNNGRGYESPDDKNSKNYQQNLYVSHSKPSIQNNLNMQSENSYF